MLTYSVCPDSPLHFIPHRFDFQRSDPSGLLYSLHKPFYIAVCFCPSRCHLTVLKPLLLRVFFKFMAVEGWSVIWFDLFLHPICVEHPPDYRYCCFLALGLLEFNHWVSGILRVEYEGDVTTRHWSAKVHAEFCGHNDPVPSQDNPFYYG